MLSTVTRWYQELRTHSSDPSSIAFGFAFGTFVSLLPTFGFGAFLVLVALTFLPSVNKPAAIIALAVWNPFVQIPLYALSFEIGSYLFATAPVITFDVAVLNHVYTFTRRFLVGHMIVTVSMTTVSYILVYSVFWWHAHRGRNRQPSLLSE
ncbi:MAG: DUF2062 domain-containing protein [Candidatus Paceibacterota bacterium]